MQKPSRVRVPPIVSFRPAEAGPYYGGGLAAIEPPDYATKPGRRKGQLADYGAFMFWLRLVLVLAWTGVLLASLIWRGVNESLSDQVSHLTNWSWNIATIFYTLDLLSHLDPTGKLALVNVLAFFWMTFGLQFVVFWLMFIALKENPNLILDASTMQGGDLPLGTVLDGDRLLHVVPVIVNILYLVLARVLVLDAVNTLCGPRAPLAIQVVYWLYAPFLSAIAPILLYLCAFDPQEIYGLSFEQLGPRCHCHWLYFAFQRPPLSRLCRQGLPRR